MRLVSETTSLPNVVASTEGQGVVLKVPEVEYRPHDRTTQNRHRTNLDNRPDRQRLPEEPDILDYFLSRSLLVSRPPAFVRPV